MKIKELIGKEVMDVEARVVGYVKDVELDLKKWAVVELIVKTGFIKRLTIQAADVDKVGDKVVLKVTLDKIRKR
jgi:sporulation protein YlmC with PRC-barrel domain